LLKLGIEISEATVSKYLPRRRKPPSQTWRSFLENHVDTLVSVDFFTVPTVFFHVPSCLRRSRPRPSAHSQHQRDQQPLGGMDGEPNRADVPVGDRATLPAPRQGRYLWRGLSQSRQESGHQGSRDCPKVPLAKSICRTSDRDPTEGVAGSRHRDQRAASSTTAAHLPLRLLPWLSNPLVARQGLARTACSGATGDGRSYRAPGRGRSASPLHATSGVATGNEGPTEGGGAPVVLGVHVDTQAGRRAEPGVASPGPFRHPRSAGTARYEVNGRDRRPGIPLDIVQVTRVASISK